MQLNPTKRHSERPLSGARICNFPNSTAGEGSCFARNEIAVGVTVQGKESKRNYFWKSQTAGFESFIGIATNSDGDATYTMALPPAPEVMVMFPLPLVGEEDME